MSLRCCAQSSCSFMWLVHSGRRSLLFKDTYVTYTWWMTVTRPWPAQHQTISDSSCWAVVAMVTGSQHPHIILTCSHCDSGSLIFIKVFVSRWRFTPPPVFGYTCDIDQICNMTVTIATEDTEFWLAGEFALFSITKRFILTAGWLLVSTAPPAGWRSKVYSDRIFILSLFRSGLNWSEHSRLKVY